MSRSATCGRSRAAGARTWHASASWSAKTCCRRSWRRLETEPTPLARGSMPQLRRSRRSVGKARLTRSSSGAVEPTLASHRTWEARPRASARNHRRDMNGAAATAFAQHLKEKMKKKKLTQMRRGPPCYECAIDTAAQEQRGLRAPCYGFATTRLRASISRRSITCDGREILPVATPSAAMRPRCALSPAQS